MTTNSNQSRDELRAQIFSSESRKPEAKVIEFFGSEVEVRQPSLSTILGAQTGNKSERDTIIVMIIDQTFVPGTNEKVFESADRDQLVSMPYGTDMNRMSRALNELTDLATDAAEGNSRKTRR